MQYMRSLREHMEEAEKSEQSCPIPEGFWRGDNDVSHVDEGQPPKHPFISVDSQGY